MGLWILGAFLFLPIFGSAVLVVKPQEEAGLSTEYLLRHAEVVSKHREPGSCPEVEDEVRVLRYFVQLTPDTRQERNIEVVVNLGRMIEHNYSWSEESWLPRRQRVVPHLNCLDQTESALLDFLRKELVWPPFPEERKSPKKCFSQGGQDVFLDKVVFKSKLRDGFFIEAGADDLITDSNTLFFEIERGWSGILVEPALWQKRSAIKRNAWTAPVCLGMHTKPHFAHFTSKALEGGMAGLVSEEREDTSEFQCFPLASILFAVGNRTVNYLSLDIEGAELQTLRTLPWNLLDIEVIGVEANHLGEVFPGSRLELHQYLGQQSYLYLGTIHVDDLFVRKDLLHRYNVDREMAEEFKKIFSFDPLDSEEHDGYKV